MDAGGAAREQVGALERRVRDAELDHRVGVLAPQLELLEQRAGDRGAAHLREALDLLDVRDRDDPGDDRDLDPDGARLLDPVEVEPVVEEQLRDQEARARRELLAQEPEVVGEVDRLGVHLGKAGGADAQVVVLADQRGQLGRVVQAAGMRAPLGLAPRRVAAQREHVVDAGVADLVEDLAQPTQDRCAMASSPCSSLIVLTISMVRSRVDPPAP